jgi:hypothetical protein
MIIDTFALFSNPQTVTTGTDSGLLSTSSYDLGLAGREIGVGQPLYVVVIVTTAFTSGGSDDDLEVQLATDDNAAMSSATIVQKLGTLPRISDAGTKMVGVIAPAAGYALERYIALVYQSVGGAGALTAGAVKAFLTQTPDAFKAYAKGYVIS